jgi:RHS repeat-associated protein
MIGNITSTTMLGTYTYNPSGPNSIRPHAVLTAGNNRYGYDLNGNMITRTEMITPGQFITYTQGWDRENRLIAVTATNGSAISVTQFVYDGDGARVLQLLPDGNQTAYAGALEVQISATQRITKTYYSVGSQLIALRVYTAPTSSVLYYLHGDHLGSTSLTTDASGTLVARQLYDAWGNIRASASSGTMPTDIGYTGQRLDATGLMYFRARYYASSLGRFVSADTLVPSPSDPQQLNRYAYARGNPVRYTDPTGHYIFEDDPNEGLVYDADRVQRHFGVRVRLRESDESWVRDTGHHPTDAEFVGAMLSRPFMALGGALLPEIGGIPGAIEDLSWKATVACANNPVCATVVMGAGAKATQGSQSAAPQIDLAAHEAAGGHLLDKHVGKTLADLAARLANSPKLQSASTFYNQASAEAAVAETLSVNQAQIATWLQGTSPGLAVTHQLSQAAGMVLSRGSSAAVEGKTVILWLVRDVAMQLGYRVHTGYLDP